MAGVRWPPEDSDLPPPRPPASAAAVAAAVDQLVSDDERSVAADSWSIKSEYGSTLDDEQRHADAAEILSGCNFPAASDYSSDKDERDSNEVEASLLGLQSYWDATYAEDLSNFHEHGHTGEIWFGNEVMSTVAAWSKNLCGSISQSKKAADCSKCVSDSDSSSKDLSSWSVLDIGTGNGLLLQELAKQGLKYQSWALATNWNSAGQVQLWDWNGKKCRFCDLTGTDYSEAAIALAQNLAIRDGFPDIKFLVDDVLESKLDRKFQLVTDKGTLDAIGLHPDGPLKRLMYWESVSNLVAPGGVLVITSCNNTKDELLQEVENFNQKMLGTLVPEEKAILFEFLDHVRTYPTIMFGGVEGSRVCTVAFRRA